MIEELYDLQEQLNSLRSTLQRQQGKYYGIRQSASYNKVCKMIDKAAQGKVSVLLLGETLARRSSKRVHLRSERDGPFIMTNCAAIPPDLIEAELFGVEKGHTPEPISPGRAALKSGWRHDLSGQGH